jgi:P-type E1-E2 ATPase
MKQLHDMVITTNQVTVMRNGRLYGDVSSETLVPGDVLVIPHEGLVMSCDAALLTGNVIVNEAMLTGESVPITKTPLPMESRAYHADSHKRHTLFAGSHVLQAQSYSQGRVLAVVVRTGFLTTKGNMVRYILFPKPLNIKFYMDSIKFVLLLSILAGCGFIYTFLILQLHQPRYQIKETILRAFDIITTVVPPSLPTAITVGTIYALNRLKKNKIYCISPQRVNLCGKVKLVCFDKTGTLTEDSLDMMGVQPVYNNKFGELLTDPSQLPLSSPFLYGMATCHSLTHINEELTGDPLDLKMFQSTNWVS